MRLAERLPICALLALTLLWGFPATSWGQTCANCSEGYYYGQQAHWWHGTDGCDEVGDLLVAVNSSGGAEAIPLSYWEGGCRICRSEYCDDPHVPHAGLCPGEACGVWNDALEAVDSEDAERLRSLLKTGGGRYRLDASKSAFQAFDCSGTLIMHITLRDELMSQLGRH